MSKNTDDKRDWCPLCTAPFQSTTPKKTLKLLADHMRSEHNRLIIEKDINAQDRLIALRARLADDVEAEIAA